MCRESSQRHPCTAVNDRLRRLRARRCSARRAAAPPQRVAQRCPQMLCCSARRRHDGGWLQRLAPDRAVQPPARASRILTRRAPRRSVLVAPASANAQAPTALPRCVASIVATFRSSVCINARRFRRRSSPSGASRASGRPTARKPAATFPAAARATFPSRAASRREFRGLAAGPLATRASLAGARFAR